MVRVGVFVPHTYVRERVTGLVVGIAERVTLNFHELSDIGLAVVDKAEGAGVVRIAVALLHQFLIEAVESQAQFSIGSQPCGLRVTGLRNDHRGLEIEVLTCGVINARQRELFLRIHQEPRERIALFTRSKLHDPGVEAFLIIVVGRLDIERIHLRYVEHDGIIRDIGTLGHEVITGYRYAGREIIAVLTLGKGLYGPGPGSVLRHGGRFRGTVNGKGSVILAIRQKHDIVGIRLGRYLPGEGDVIAAEDLCMGINRLVGVGTYGEGTRYLGSERGVVLIDKLEDRLIGLTLYYLHGERTDCLDFGIVEVIESDGLAGTYGYIETLSGREGRLLPGEGSGFLILRYSHFEVRDRTVLEFELNGRDERSLTGGSAIRIDLHLVLARAKSEERRSGRGDMANALIPCIAFRQTTVLIFGIEDPTGRAVEVVLVVIVLGEAVKEAELFVGISETVALAGGRYDTGYQCLIFHAEESDSEGLGVIAVPGEAGFAVTQAIDIRIGQLLLRGVDLAGLTDLRYDEVIHRQSAEVGRTACKTEGDELHVCRYCAENDGLTDVLDGLRQGLEGDEGSRVGGVGHITDLRHTVVGANDVGMVVKRYLKGVERCVKDGECKDLRGVGSAAGYAQMCLTVDDLCFSFVVISLVGYYPHLWRLGSDGPAVGLYVTRRIAAEGLDPGDRLQFARGFEGRLRRQTLLALGAVRTYVEVIGGTLVEAREGDGFLIGLDSLSPVRCFAAEDVDVLELCRIALPRDSSGLVGKVRNGDVRRFVAGSVTGDRHALNVIEVDTVTLVGLVESDKDTLSYVGTEIDGERTPVGLRDFVRLGLRGGVERLHYRKRRCLRTGRRDLYAELSFGGVILDACGELQCLACGGLQFRRDEITLRSTVRTEDIGTFAALFGRLNPL